MATSAHCWNKKYAQSHHQQLRHLLAFLFHHQRFPLLMQITALGGDVECVLKFAHDLNPLWFLTVLFLFLDWLVLLKAVWKFLGRIVGWIRRNTATQQKSSIRYNFAFSDGLGLKLQHSIIGLHIQPILWLPTTIRTFKCSCRVCGIATHAFYH